MSPEEIDAEARLRELDKETRVLARKLARMDSNVRQMEEMQDATSKLLSGLTRELEEARARSQALLLNILPQQIVDRLGAGEQVIADRYAHVTVLFSDLVGFTETSSEMDPHRLVSELNVLFSRFDALCERTGVEKIKTIGDAYMAVVGCRVPGSITSPRSPSWPCRWLARPRVSTIPAADRGGFASGFTRGPRWPASSEPGSSSTTCGATR